MFALPHNPVEAILDLAAKVGIYAFKHSTSCFTHFGLA